jgi:hypothetical protein
MPGSPDKAAASSGPPTSAADVWWMVYQMPQTGKFPVQRGTYHGFGSSKTGQTAPRTEPNP